MDIQSDKPRKILHYDPQASRSRQTEQQYFQEHWAVIEQTVGQYLLDVGPPPNIIRLSRSLQILLQRQCYPQLHERLIKLFYEIYKRLLEGVGQGSNILLTLLAYYIGKKQHYRILFDLLNNYLLIYSQLDRQTLEQKAYHILCKEICNSHLFQKITAELMTIVQTFRTTKDHNELIEIEYQLKIVAMLGIYQYCDQEFLERSKLYFIDFSQQIAKNQHIFEIIDHALKRETALNKLLKPSEDTLRYLQKELIEEYYPFMIEYMDYLVQENKLDKLKMLWSYSLRLNASDRHLLDTRLQQIVKDVIVFVREGDQLSKILEFIDKMGNIVTFCFDGNKSTMNLLHNSIEEILNEHERKYSEVLSSHIFTLSTVYSPETVYKLFRLIPNKQKFIQQLEIRFFRWILSHEVPSMCYQEQIIQLIKKECGNALCKKMERMMGDVWRDGQMLYYHLPARSFKCRLLSGNEWPRFTYENITLPDAMQEIINEFEAEYKRSAENNYKELKWINEFGTVELAINGVTSTFSECQTAIIFVLDKAIRPMKKEQLAQILQGSYKLISTAVDELHSSGVLQHNDQNQTYDINDSNEQTYKVVKEQKQNVQEIKTLSKRDDTIIIQAAIIRILKKKKTLQKTDLTKNIYDYISTFKPTLEQINQALERLAIRDFIEIDKTKGTLKYIE